MKKHEHEGMHFYSLDWKQEREFSTPKKRIAVYIMFVIVILIGYFLALQIVMAETQASQVALSNHKAFVYQHPWWKIK